jgi:hypothetical protein
MRFCPFCREAFDDVTRCPSHDVELVTLRELGAMAALDVSDDLDASVWSPRRGRGVLAAGAALTLLAFFCPFGTLVGPVTVTNTLLNLARGRSLKLWIVPVAALALLLMLYRRRSGPALRGARLAALFVSVLPSAVVASTWVGARGAAAELAAESRRAIEFHLGAGSWLVFVAAAICCWGSVMLGARPARRLR